MLVGLFQLLIFFAFSYILTIYTVVFEVIFAVLLTMDFIGPLSVCNPLKLLVILLINHLNWFSSALLQQMTKQ